jgi:glutaminase A
LEGRLAVPNWPEFSAKITELYNVIKSRPLRGANASYIPILEEADSNWFGISVCTVDGQRFDIGDTDVDFSIQSCVKPLMYAVAIEDVGLERVHKHVGIEPSGLAFNEVSLNADGLPHNPMVNAGAIATGSCVKPGADMSTRFKHFSDKLKALAGGAGKVGFSQPTYLCEFETAWRNNALMYYMEEAGVFPVDVTPEAALDFYIQCCAIEVNTASAAGMAATLANGGTSPLTGVPCLSTATVKSVLTLMFSCGMYDYSGEWCVHVGLPAKSGVAGLVYVVIPHVMGIAIFSPPLDSHGNSVRGVEFCKRLLHNYPYGVFDSMTNTLSNGEDDVDEMAILPVADDDCYAMTPTSKHEVAKFALAKRIFKAMVKLYHSMTYIGKFYAVAAPTPRASSAPSSVSSSSADLNTSSGSVKSVRLSVGGKVTTASKLHGTYRYVGTATAASRDPTCIPLASVIAFLQSKGVSCSKRQNPAVAGLLEALQMSVPGHISLRDVVLLPGRGNLLIKALLGRLAMPDFATFSRKLTDIYHAVEATPTQEATCLARIQAEIKEMSCLEGDFVVAACTVDGQQFRYGSESRPIPLMETIKPLLYAVALRDCGRNAVHEVRVGVLYAVWHIVNWIVDGTVRFPVGSV